MNKVMIELKNESNVSFQINNDTHIQISKKDCGTLIELFQKTRANEFIKMNDLLSVLGVLFVFYLCQVL